MLVHRPLRLISNVSNGDLRRLLERDGLHTLGRTAGEFINPNTRTSDGTPFAIAVLVLAKEKKITLASSLPVSLLSTTSGYLS
jgi:hypothetical protein